jgi:hypothetical protein
MAQRAWLSLIDPTFHLYSLPSPSFHSRRSKIPRSDAQPATNEPIRGISVICARDVPDDVGELRLLLRDYDADTHIGVVWPRPQVAEEGPWLAEIEKLIKATANDTGEVDLFLEAIEFVDDLTSESH